MRWHTRDGGPDETNIRNRHCNSPTIENIKHREKGDEKVRVEGGSGGGEGKMHAPCDRSRRTPWKRKKVKISTLIISPNGIIPKNIHGIHTYGK